MRIAAEVLADSTFDGHRVTTIVAEYPRWLHAELMTHRVFARNAASSRALPVAHMIQQAESWYNDPIFYKEQKGMKGSELLPYDEYLIPESTLEELRQLLRTATIKEGLEAADKARRSTQKNAQRIWRKAAQACLECAEELKSIGVHKAEANRLLEPFSNIRVIITGDEWANFFRLRLHGDAEPHFQVLATEIAVAITKSTPDNTQFHLPYLTEPECTQFIQELDAITTAFASMTGSIIDKNCRACNGTGLTEVFMSERSNGKRLTTRPCARSASIYLQDLLLKYGERVAARCARVSWRRDMLEPNPTKDKETAELLVNGSGFGHWSPWEHAAIHPCILPLLPPMFSTPNKCCLANWHTFRSTFFKEREFVKGYQIEDWPRLPLVKEMHAIEDRRKAEIKAEIKAAQS